MAEKREILKVSGEAHRKIKILAAKHGKTMIDYVEELADKEWEKDEKWVGR